MVEIQCCGKPLVARNGLGDLARKLRSRKPCTVAYLGGSITWGGNASDITRFSYRARTTAGLRERFPACTITEVDAGIGGTGSDLGAFRVGEDVLRFAPDLLFIEFAVNDSGTPDETILNAIEGIVRQCLLRPAPFSPPALCFIYTLSKGHLPEISRGVLPRAAARHEQIAAHYGIPSINVALPVAESVASGELKWETFAKDDVHPTDKGHELYARTIAAALAEMLDHDATPPERSAVLPAPWNVRPWDTARCLPMPRQAGALADWNYKTLVKLGGWECFDGVLESNRPGSEARFEFEGTTVGLYYLLGPDTGNLLYSIDQEPFQKLEPFDKWAVDCTRPHYRILSSSLKPGAHVLRIQVSADHDPLSKGQWTRLAYVMYL